MKYLFLILLFFSIQSLSTVCIAENQCFSKKKLIEHTVNTDNYEMKIMESDERWGVDRLYSSFSRILIEPDHPSYGKKIKKTFYCDKRYNYYGCNDDAVWHTLKELLYYESNGSDIICSSTGETYTLKNGIQSYKRRIFYYTAPMDN